MNLLKLIIAASSVMLTGAAANAAPATALNATACIPQSINAAPPGKGGWPAATNIPNTCATASTAACAKPETIAGFNGKFGFRVPAVAGVDCSGKTLTGR